MIKRWGQWLLPLNCRKLLGCNLMGIYGRWHWWRKNWYEHKGKRKLRRLLVRSIIQQRNGGESSANCYDFKWILEHLLFLKQKKNSMKYSTVLLTKSHPINRYATMLSHRQSHCRRITSRRTTQLMQRAIVNVFQYTNFWVILLLFKIMP